MSARGGRYQTKIRDSGCAANRQPQNVERQTPNIGIDNWRVKRFEADD
jgi:hypothetical protein